MAVNPSREQSCPGFLQSVEAKRSLTIKNRTFQMNHLKINQVDAMCMWSFWAQGSLDWEWQFDSSSKVMKTLYYLSRRQILGVPGVTIPILAVLATSPPTCTPSLSRSIQIGAGLTLHNARFGIIYAAVRNTTASFLTFFGTTNCWKLRGMKLTNAGISPPRKVSSLPTSSFSATAHSVNHLFRSFQVLINSKGLSSTRHSGIMTTNYQGRAWL